MKMRLKRKRSATVYNVYNIILYDVLARGKAWNKVKILVMKIS